MPEIIVATSIAPGNIASQRLAIGSWLKLGLTVVSLNVQNEIDKLAPEFPDVTFFPASRSALQLTGKPYVFFDDILKLLSSVGSEICGIINSDIVLSAKVDLVDFVMQYAADKLLYFSRVDVASMQDGCGKLYSYGFDVFFFPKQLALEYPSSDFCLGVPWWDYWALLVPVSKGYQVYEVIGPVAFHAQHEVNWKRNLHGLFCQHLLFSMQSNGLLDDAHEKLLSQLSAAYASNNFLLISLLCLRHVQQYAQKVAIDIITENNLFLLNQFICLRDDLVETKINLCCVNAEAGKLPSNIGSPDNIVEDQSTAGYNAGNSGIKILRKIIWFVRSKLD